MQLFVTVLIIAAIVALTRADISLSQGGYHYRPQQPILSQLIQQHQQQHHHRSLDGGVFVPERTRDFSANDHQPGVFVHSTKEPLQQQQQHHQNQQQQSQLLPLPFILSQQEQQQQPQYLPPVNQYQTQQPQQPHQQPHRPAGFPMPAGFPVNFQTAPATPHRRPRLRTRIPKKPIITKNFFIHSAPEESNDEIEEELAQLAQQPRQHYNVLFVKAPAQTNKAAALSLAKTLKQEKTVVYVLAKKTSAADLQDAIAEVPQTITKPEVFFIKYRTPEEAINAQRQIQSQYDSLGGTSTITDEGVAPITSVVGSLDAPEENEEELQQLQQPQQQQHQQGPIGQQPLINNSNLNLNNHYLPTNQF